VSQRFALVTLVSVLALLQQAHAADRVVVLVTSSDCAMEAISTLDIRKAYLGFGVSYEEKSVRAFRLGNDTKLNQIFLQSVVAMSEKTYERRLLLQLVKYGQPRPREFGSVSELAAALKEGPCNIAYMWQSDLKERTGIKGIKVIWQEN
jgi:hypothetical protein